VDIFSYHFFAKKYGNLEKEKKEIQNFTSLYGGEVWNLHRISGSGSALKRV
jgi:hypothetical protein